MNYFFNKIFRKRKTDITLLYNINDPAIIKLSNKPKTRSVLAAEYGVSVRTLNRWLAEKELHIPQGLICPADLKTIYSSLGLPKSESKS